MKTLIAVSLLLVSLVLADEAKSLLKPTNKVETWRFEQHEGGKGSMKVDGDAIVFTIDEVDGTDWHVQAVQTDLDLKAGTQYLLKFEIKASENRSITVGANIDEEDWHSIGLHEQIFIGKEFKPQTLVFTAESVAAKKNRIGLVLGEAKGTVSVKNMTLTAK